MCDVTMGLGLGMMALNAGKMFVDIQSQTDAAQKQRKYLQRQASAQEDAAKAARELDLAAAQARAEQISDKGSNTAFERVRQAARETAKLKLSSAEAGVFGRSIFQQLLSSQVQSEHDIGLIRTDTKNEMAQNTLQKQSIEATYTSRMNEAASTREQAKLSKGPSTLSSIMNVGLGGAGGFFSGYTMGGQIK